MPDESSQTWTVKRLLEWTTGFFERKHIDPSRLSAEMLLAHVLEISRIKLYTGFERIVVEKDLAVFRELVRRASEEEPIAYLTGKAPFFNLEFHVTRDVLIPRPDTETVVENVLQLARRATGFEAPRVLDLCTGSGCIAAAIAHHNKSATVVATEIRPAALDIARRNIEQHGVMDRVTLLLGDLYEPLTQEIDRRPFDLIVSNPPYIASSDIEKLPRSVREYEPLTALDGGLDGLSFHRRILEGAASRIRSGGVLFLEIAFNQAEQACAIAAQYPDFDQVRVLRDHAGNDRVLTLTRR